MQYPSYIWDQLKNLTPDNLIHALEKDGWIRDTSHGASFIYKKNQNRVSIHYHPRKTYGPKLLKGLLDDIGWNEDDYRRLKLIK